MDGESVRRHWEEIQKDPLRIYNPTGNFEDRKNNSYIMITGVRVADAERLWKYKGVIYNKLPVKDDSLEILLVDGFVKENVSEKQIISRASYFELSKKFLKDFSNE